jgi:hypothetical protein
MRQYISYSRTSRKLMILPVYDKAWYDKACICEHLSYTFPIQNGIKQRAALSPLLLNFTLECAITKT